MPCKNLGAKILELRKFKYTYKQISEILNCNIGTVKYHLNPNRKTNEKLRNKKRRSRNHPYKAKIQAFTSTYIRYDYNRHSTNASILLSLNRKISDFCRTTIIEGDNTIKKQFSVEDVINKFGDNPKCALTGLQLDISKPATYNFDHIIPKTRGGTNSIDNLQLVTKQVNSAKGNMTPDEFINLCKLVLENKGFTITKQ